MKLSGGKSCLVYLITRRRTGIIPIRKAETRNAVNPSSKHVHISIHLYREDAILTRHGGDFPTGEIQDLNRSYLRGSTQWPDKVTSSGQGEINLCPSGRIRREYMYGGVVLKQNWMVRRAGRLPRLVPHKYTHTITAGPLYRLRSTYSFTFAWPRTGNEQVHTHTCNCIQRMLMVTKRLERDDGTA
jgi:hypothetical protein